MKKTSLYLDPAIDHALARQAAREGIAKAELIRRTLAEAVTGQPPPRPAACGAFHGPTDLARETDRHLADTGFGAA